MSRTLGALAVLLGLLGLATVPLATGADKSESPVKPVKFTPESIKWAQGPPSLPSGVQVAVLEGDLAKSGPYVFRVKAPDSYQIPPHRHPDDECLTVLKGTLMVGEGSKVDRSAASELPAGSLYILPKGHEHYVWTKGETIIQVHGMGPWGITYVNPEDDPRKKGK